ncbi:MAG: hypothetical protein K1V76_05830 [Candidatus Amulumruptor sp.]
MTSSEYTPLEQPASVATASRGFTIGVPACRHEGERRFPLTPEGASRLIERGFRVKIESGASAPIHYTDNQYLRAGCDVVSRSEALQCEIVIHLSPLDMPDVRHLRRGSLLLTLLSTELVSKEYIKALMEKHTVAIALDLIEDEHGHRPFADILAEIDGRAAMAMAASLLADSEHGKGILLGGIAGINPCEVVILGSGIAAVSAARTATGMGAIVRMFDNDVYSLRHASRELGASLITSAMHPRVISGALHTADVIIATPTSDSSYTIDSEEAMLLKRGVLTFDLTDRGMSPFPSMQPIDLARADSNKCRRPDGWRACYIHAGSAVPRTCAMALSNTLMTMLTSVCTCDGVHNALKLLPGLRKAAYLFLGKLVNEEIGEKTGIRALDINLYLTLS